MKRAQNNLEDLAAKDPAMTVMDAREATAVQFEKKYVIRVYS
jgi:hypothetical protein